MNSNYGDYGRLSVVGLWQIQTYYGGMTVLDARTISSRTSSYDLQILTKSSRNYGVSGIMAVSADRVPSRTSPHPWTACEHVPDSDSDVADPLLYCLPASGSQWPTAMRMSSFPKITRIMPVNEQKKTKKET